MTHIKTASQEEVAMRDQYQRVTEAAPVRATAEHLALIGDIRDNTQAMDLLKLKISEDHGRLMTFMKGHGKLVDDQGRTLVTWENASDKAVVDWDGLVREMNIPPETVARFTTVKPGTRVFRVLD